MALTIIAIITITVLTFYLLSVISTNENNKLIEDLTKNIKE
jgi:hypothetical protein